MAEASRVYEEGDEDRLEAILREWEMSPESGKDDGFGAKLFRVIRRGYPVWFWFLGIISWEHKMWACYCHRSKSK
jgi:hypothetical protein